MIYHFVLRFRFFALLCLFPSIAPAQLVNIPDANLRTYLQGLPALRNCWVGNQLNTQCAGVGQVRTLKFPLFSNIIQLNGVQHFNNLDSLDASFLFNLFELPPLPARLVYLNCSRNPLPLLPQLPASLQTLMVEGCGMADLPPLPRGLRVLNCSFNPNLSFPPVLPDSLRELSMINNQVSKLPPLPARLRTFYVGFNQLSSLSALPNTLTTLIINDNPIRCLPRLPASMRTISVARTNVNCLPNIPAGLAQIDGTNYGVCSTGSSCLSSATHEVDSGGQMKVWYTTDGLRITAVGMNGAALLRIRVFNAWGQLMTQSALPANGDSTLPLALPPGVYVYSVQQEALGRLYSGKIVVQD
jgi:hypothetical protein